MKLASLKGGRDGRLVVVSNDLAWFTDAGTIAPTLQAALDDWERCGPMLAGLAESLEHGAVPRVPRRVVRGRSMQLTVRASFRVCQHAVRKGGPLASCGPAVCRLRRVPCMVRVSASGVRRINRHCVLRADGVQ